MDDAAEVAASSRSTDLDLRIQLDPECLDLDLKRERGLVRARPTTRYTLVDDRNTMISMHRIELPINKSWSTLDTVRVVPDSVQALLQLNTSPAEWGILSSKVTYNVPRPSIDKPVKIVGAEIECGPMGGGSRGDTADRCIDQGSIRFAAALVTATGAFVQPVESGQLASVDGPAMFCATRGGVALSDAPGATKQDSDAQSRSQEVSAIQVWCAIRRDQATRTATLDRVQGHSTLIIPCCVRLVFRRPVADAATSQL